MLEKFELQRHRLGEAEGAGGDLEHRRLADMLGDPLMGEEDGGRDDGHGATKPARRVTLHGASGGANSAS